MTTNSLAVPRLPPTSSAMFAIFSGHSTKTTKLPRQTQEAPPRALRCADTATPGVARRWSVEAHREVRKLIALYGLEADIFRPSLAELLAALEANPKQFPMKRGKLKNARAADVTFRNGVVWRAVFTLDEPSRVVRLLALGPHDTAYSESERRI